MARLLGWVAASIVKMSLADQPSWPVADCSECPTLSEFAQKPNATCLPDEDESSGQLYCTCYRPYMQNWEILEDGTMVTFDGYPRCRHAMSYPGMAVVEYLPVVLFVFAIVYSVLILRDKAVALTARDEDGNDDASSEYDDEEVTPTKRTCRCNQLIGGVVLVIVMSLTRIFYVGLDPRSFYEIMPAAVNDVLLRVGFVATLITVGIVIDSWYVVLEMLPLQVVDTGKSCCSCFQFHGVNEHNQQRGGSNVARRLTLYISGIITIGLETAGLVVQFTDPDAEVLGFNFTDFVQFVTIILWAVAMVLWAISGTIFLRSLLKVADSEPRVMDLVFLFRTHLIVLVVTYVAYAILGLLFTFLFSDDPYALIISVTLHRGCEFVMIYSLLRIIDGQGTGYCSPLLACERKPDMKRRDSEISDSASVSTAEDDDNKQDNESPRVSAKLVAEVDEEDDVVMSCEQGADNEEEENATGSTNTSDSENMPVQLTSHHPAQQTSETQSPKRVPATTDNGGVRLEMVVVGPS